MRAKQEAANARKEAEQAAKASASVAGKIMKGPKI